MVDYCKQAKTAIEALKAAGYDAEHIETADAVKVIIDGEIWYNVSAIDNMPDSLPVTSIVIRRLKQISLYYKNNAEYTIRLSKSAVFIRGKIYYYQDDVILMGYLHNNAYIGLLDKWIGGNGYYLTCMGMENKLHEIEEGDILDLDFTPTVPQIIDIQNKGYKLIKRNFINESKINAFTVFTNAHIYVTHGEGKLNYIATGKYKESGRDDIFKYISEEGEAFALLIDTQTKAAYLANAAKSIKLTRTKKCIVKNIDGLYNGYELEWKYKSSIMLRDIYFFKDIFFTSITNKKNNDDIDSIIEISARMPNSGMHTKAATAAE